MELTATASNAVMETSGTLEEPQTNFTAQPEKSQPEETEPETQTTGQIYTATIEAPSDAVPVSPESFPMLYEILFVLVFILFFLCGILLEKVLFRRM